jgi:hypothetical protein
MSLIQKRFPKLYEGLGIFFRSLRKKFTGRLENVYGAFGKSFQRIWNTRKFRCFDFTKNKKDPHFLTI